MIAVIVVTCVILVGGLVAFSLAKAAGKADRDSERDRDEWRP